MFSFSLLPSIVTEIPLTSGTTQVSRVVSSCMGKLSQYESGLIKIILFMSVPKVRSCHCWPIVKPDLVTRSKITESKLPVNTQITD